MRGSLNVSIEMALRTETGGKGLGMKPRSAVVVGTLLGLAAGLTVAGHSFAAPQVAAAPPNFTSQENVLKIANTAVAKLGKRIATSSQNNAPIVLSIATQPSTTNLQVHNAKVYFNTGTATFKSGESMASGGKVYFTAPAAMNKLTLMDCPIVNTTAKAKYTVGPATSGGTTTLLENPITYVSPNGGNVAVSIAATNATETEWSWSSCRIYSYDYN
jgi:hypothetical protein